MSYYLFRLAVGLFWLCPFWLLYLFSNLLYYFLYYVLRYRRKTVLRNLALAFPDKSETELQQISRRFFRHLCDISLESIKGLSLSEAAIAQRWRIRNPEFLNSFHAQGQSVIFAGSHYSNWEWAPLSAPAQTYAKLVVIYKPLSNRRIDQHLRQLRGQHRTEMRSIKETNQCFVDNQTNVCAFALVGDQSPSNLKEAHFVPFLGSQVPFLHGIAKYAQVYNLPVIYYHTRRIKRGYYEVDAELLVGNPTELAAEEITARFAAQVESDILANPSDWLWSHKRWKHLDKS